MFGSLIRRKTVQLQPGEVDESVFESTTFSLSTTVPRPSERRTDERVAPILRIAKLLTEDGERLLRVRNMSAGGLMAEVTSPPEVGKAVEIEFSTQKIPAMVVWIREGMVGLKFDQNLDLGMPGMDGVELLRFLAEQDFQAPVLIISGFDRRVLESAFRLGEALGLTMAGPLEKPVRLEELENLLNRLKPTLVQ